MSSVAGTSDCEIDESFDSASAFPLKDSESQTAPIVHSTQELLNLFECPVCYDYILPPIQQCVQGHLICVSCRSKVSSCPTCRESLGNIRCLAIEKVADSILFPCKYSTQGCAVMLQRTQKQQHEAEQCESRPFLCPYTFIDTCNEWYGVRDKVVEHLLGSHTENFKKEHGQLEPVQGDHLRFTPYVNIIDYNSDNSTTSWVWTILQQCYNCCFVINLYYIHNGVLNIHFVTVRAIATEELSKKFCYTSSIEGPLGKLSYSGTVRSLHANVRDIYEARDCLAFDAATGHKYKTKVKSDGNVRRQVLNIVIDIRPR